MEINIVTMEDLMELKQEILSEINHILDIKINKEDSRHWYRSAEVRKMLKISPGTLQNLRIKGTLLYRKVGGTMFYKRKDILKMMEGGQSA